MNGEILIIAILAVIWLGVYALTRILKLDLGEKIDVGPLYVMLRSESLNALWSEAVLERRRVMRILFNVGVACSLVAMIYGVYFLFDSALRILAAPTEVQPTIALLIPGVTITGTLLLTALPAFVLVLVTHEFSHKLAAHLHNVRVKSVGVGLFLILPLAFVEPDETEFEESEPTTRLHVLGAGSYANIGLAILFLLVITAGYSQPQGIVLGEVTEDGPLQKMTEIDPGDVLVGIDDAQMTVQELFRVWADLQPGKLITLYYYESGSVARPSRLQSTTIVTAPAPENASRGIIGGTPLSQPFLGFVLYSPPRIPLFSVGTTIFLYQTQFWVFFIGLGVGIFNMLPVLPLDGFGFVTALMERLGMKESTNRIISYGLMIFSLGLLVLNLGFPYFT